MGVRLIGSSCSSCDCSSIMTPSKTPVPCSPDPSNFQILEAEQVGNHVVTRIHYMGCTNYEGSKIMLYINTTVGELKSKLTIDPHFNETGFSPFARFEPTNLGWDAAVALAQSFS